MIRSYPWLQDRNYWLAVSVHSIAHRLLAIHSWKQTRPSLSFWEGLALPVHEQPSMWAHIFLIPLVQPHIWMRVYALLCLQSPLIPVIVALKAFSPWKTKCMWPKTGLKSIMHWPFFMPCDHFSTKIQSILWASSLHLLLSSLQNVLCMLWNFVSWQAQLQ